jgi:hypothetical protein
MDEMIEKETIRYFLNELELEKYSTFLKLFPQDISSDLVGELVVSQLTSSINEKGSPSWQKLSINLPLEARLNNKK